MDRLRLMLAYDGAAFVGSQVQLGQRTVQGVVEAALGTLNGQSVRIVLAGRTDTGVHAQGQVAHADVDRVRGLDQWMHGLNGLLPPDVRVTNVVVARGTFHARFDAIGRTYRYRIWNGPVQPPLLRGTTWHRRSVLDMDAMNAACRVLIGEHDFAAFAGDGRGVPGRSNRTVRTVRSAGWMAERSLDDVSGCALVFTVEASGFLPHMVRNLVGSLVLIGSGERAAEWMETLLHGRDRRSAAPTAPPQGLTLWRVTYNEDAEKVPAITITTVDAGSVGETSECRH